MLINQLKLRCGTVSSRALAF
uniref:Uncharacterized protein n=1 Tax=Anguilla anguilla TaxID=7936 RepID=A0A0E9UZM1_ANGAN